MSVLSRLSAVGLALALVAGVPATAHATSSASVTRLGGADRFGTAATISRDVWNDTQAQSVVLARSDAFPDALAGTPLAAAKNGPLLLTPSRTLHPTTAAELRRVLSAGRNVYLLGGTTALSDGVARSVAALGYKVVRLGGADRYSTAVIISQQLGTPSTIFEATGLDYPDALMAGVAAAEVDGVVVLTAASRMPASTKAYLDRHPGRPRVAVGPEAAAADPAATRVVGADKYDTSRLLAERYFPAATRVALASGTDFADALAGGAHIGRLGGPLLLTAPGALPGAVRTYLAKNSSRLSAAVVYGGPVAVSTTAEDVAANTLRGATFFGEGTKRVGVDLQPGTYRTRRDAPELCYWQRLSGFSGDFDDIITNGLSVTHEVVTIEASDAGFSSRDCGVWTSDLSPLTTSPTAPFGNGTWIVGTDISPGTWTAPGGDRCYWERLAGFGHGIEDILANEVAVKDPVVTIAASDAGFSAAECGRWTRLD